jgi:hypothetical protein
MKSLNDTTLQALVTQRKSWYLQDLQFIRDNYKTMYLKDIADHLAIAQYKVKTMMEVMGVEPLKKPYHITYHIYITQEDWQKATIECKALGINKVNLFSNIIRKHFESCQSTTTQTDLQKQTTSASRG